MEAVIDGDVSTVGRATSRNLTRLRTKVYGEEASASKTHGDDGSPRPASLVSPYSPEAKLEAKLRATVESLRGGGTLKNLNSTGSLGDLNATDRLGDTSRDVPSTLKGTMTMGLGGASGGGQELEEGSRQKPAQLDETLLDVAKSPGKPSPAFTSIGQETSRYCESARALLGRFTFPVKLEERPEVGRYEVTHGDKSFAIVKARHPKCDFRMQPKHPSRKLPDTSSEMDPFASQDLFNASISSFHEAYTTNPPEKEPMRLKTSRPPLEKCQGRTFRDGIQMNEAPLFVKEWCVHDVHSSKRWREPEMDIDRLATGHQVSVIKGYYEPGKYAVKWTTQEPSVKSGPEFSRRLSRSVSAGHTGHASGQLGHLAPKAELHREGSQGNHRASIKERSKARDCPLTRPRVVKVSNFKDELDRPPLMAPSPIYYDEDDQDVLATTFEREMTFDADIVDRAVIPRRDRGPDMKHSLSRDHAGRGFRLFQADQGVRMSKGFAHGDDQSHSLATVERAKEVPSRPRPDMGVTFDHKPGRSTASPKTRKTHSALRQPRENAAPDFSRTSPKRGFATRASVERPQVVAWARAHEAIPTWATDSIDEAELHSHP